MVSFLFQVSADSVIRTTGGNVSVKRLVGTTIDVNTGGGDMLIGSLYGNGTDFTISELQPLSYFHLSVCALPPAG
jgi:hypothetical protein